MRTRPILFNAQMVSAILDSRKTQTRRVMKPQPAPGQYVGRNRFNTTGWSIFELGEAFDPVVRDNIKCPYGQPGDRLWVRETWRECQEQPGIMYRADGWEDMQANYDLKWRPSIHMPRHACRITLEVTNVRVQRIQDISEEDARAEGVYPQDAIINASCRWLFRRLWDSINAKRGYGWDANPWVWAVTFERVPQ